MAKKKKRRGSSSIPWIPIAGGVGFLAVLLIGGVLYVLMHKKDPKEPDAPLTYSDAGGSEFGCRFKVVGKVSYTSAQTVTGDTGLDTVRVSAHRFDVPKGMPTATAEQLYAVLKQELSQDDVAYKNMEATMFRGASGIVVRATNNGRPYPIVLLFAVKNGKGYVIQILGNKMSLPDEVVKTVKESVELL